MNSRRKANRAKSLARAGKPAADHSLAYPKAERHEDMRGRKIAHREPQHHEEGGNYAHTAHASMGSPASIGASKGPGPLPGAGTTPAKGPGVAARGYAGAMNTEDRATPAGTPPKGMAVYAEGE